MSPDSIIFAIQAAVRLGQEARRAYMDTTRSRELVLPLPDVGGMQPTPQAVYNWLKRDGADYLQYEAHQQLAALHGRYAGLEPEEKQRYTGLGFVLMRYDAAKKNDILMLLADGVKVHPDDYLSLHRIEQYQDGSPNEPKLLQRFVGTVIEIGVDYVANMPGVVSTQSRTGRFIIGFAAALDEVKFSELVVSEGAARKIVRRLMIAGLETLGDQPEIVASDKNVQDLVKVGTKGLAKDIAIGVNQLSGNLTGQERVETWGELVFRSLLSSAGRYVVEAPERYLGVTGEAKRALITKAGTALIDLAVENQQLNLDRVFSRKGVETLLDASLRVLAEHPELVVEDGNKGVLQIVADMAQALADQDTLLTPDIVPEVMRLALEKTGRNIELIWPDLSGAPEKHLLATAAKSVLIELSAKPDSGNWTLNFGTVQALTVVDAVLEEMSSNPQWLIDAASGIDANLGAAIGATLDVLRQKADNRLSPETAVDILRASAHAVALRQKFVRKVGGQTLVAAAVEAVIGAVFNPDNNPEADWQLLRHEALAVMVRIALKQFARSAMTPTKLTALQTTTNTYVAKVVAGDLFDPDVFETDLHAALAA